VSLYLAAYDISHTGHRSRVARVLRRHGRRIQRSVFELWLEPEDLPELRMKIGPLLARTDSFDLVPVDLRRPEQRFRWQRPLDNGQPVLLL